MSDPICKGDIVTLLPQWREPGEENYTYVARDDEEKGRLDISALEQSDWPVWPRQTVHAYMVVKTGRRRG